MKTKEFLALADSLGWQNFPTHFPHPPNSLPLPPSPLLHPYGGGASLTKLQKFRFPYSHLLVITITWRRLAMGWYQLVEFLSEKNDKCFINTTFIVGVQWVLSFLDKNADFVELIWVDPSHGGGRGTSGFITNNNGFEVLRPQEHSGHSCDYKKGWEGLISQNMGKEVILQNWAYGYFVYYRQ